MSKGIGQVQQGILAALGRADSPAMTIKELARTGGCGDPRDTRRAVRSLEDRGRVLVTTAPGNMVPQTDGTRRRVGDVTSADALWVWLPDDQAAWAQASEATASDGYTGDYGRYVVTIIGGPMAGRSMRVHRVPLAKMTVQGTDYRHDGPDADDTVTYRVAS